MLEICAKRLYDDFIRSMIVVSKGAFVMKFSSRLQRFFQGRYGYDALSKALLITALILSLLVLVFRLEVLAPLPLILLLFVFYRAYSKNYAARRGGKMTGTFNWREKQKTFSSCKKNKFRDRKTHRYLRYKSCKNVLRVPRGKGEIHVTCPVCRTGFDIRT